MPKTRERAAQKGAKSSSMRIKHKLGGRKSTVGANLISRKALLAMLGKVQKKDRNKFRRALESRGIILPS